MVSIRLLHPWRVSVESAIKIQEELRNRVILMDVHKTVEKIAGVDVGYKRGKIISAVCIFRCLERGLEHLETQVAENTLSFPYIPGLLTFREGPVIIKAFRRIKNKPDVILFDGQGVCHPRRMGIATHLGIILDIPSIGCAKNPLCGIWQMPGLQRGSFSFIYDNETNEKIGAVLRTRAGVRPIFVSPGYKITLKESIDLALQVSRYRIPEPLRYAHREANLCL